MKTSMIKLLSLFLAASCANSTVEVKTKKVQKTSFREPVKNYYEEVKPPPELINLYKVCSQNKLWGYVVGKKPINSNVIMYATSSRDETVHGEYKTQSDCHEARLAIKAKPGETIEERCVERYLGESQSFTLYKAKAMYKHGPYNKMKEYELTFSSLDVCKKNVSTSRSYNIPFIKNEPIVANIGPYKSQFESRFITDCYASNFIVCEKNTDGINRPELHD